MAEMQVDVVMGGPGREAAVSRQSGAAISAALRQAGCDVVDIDCHGELDLNDLRADSVVFNIIHGTYGEDGSLQQQLDDAGRAYVGSDATASKLCMDKVATRDCVAAADVPVAWGVGFDPRSLQDPRDLKAPYQVGFVLKPRRDGSSVGLRLLPSTSFLLPALEEIVAELGPVPMLLEERLPGPEFTVGVLDDEQGQPQPLPVIRIEPAGETFDYAAKYEAEDTAKTIIDGDAATRMQDLAVAAYRACGCRDFARIDFMDDRAGQPKLLEINTLPGFTDHSLLPRAAAAVNISFSELCVQLVRLAQQRRIQTLGSES